MNNINSDLYSKIGGSRRKEDVDSQNSTKGVNNSPVNHDDEEKIDIN